MLDDNRSDFDQRQTMPFQFRLKPVNEPRVPLNATAKPQRQSLLHQGEFGGIGH